MSRAFVRESDDAPERPVTRPSPLPPGVVNYITPGGAHRLRGELTQLLAVPRPRPAEMEERIRYLQESLRTAEIVPPPSGPEPRVRFGATVTVRDREGETTYRIVGVDETDFDKNWISWVSPIAKALLNAQVGQRVHFRQTDLEILHVTYPPANTE